MKIRSKGKMHYFFCPGCNNSVHAVNERWVYNGDPNLPTITPSINVTWTEGDDNTNCCCHSFVKDGKIQFLPDCTHELAGQTVDIPEWDW